MTRALLLVSVALVAAFASQSHAQSSAGGGVRLPPFEQHTLANGVVLVLMEKHDTPLVSMRALLRGGSLGDPAGKEGSAALLAELLKKGAGKRDAVAFAEAIESVGGELAASAETESLAVGASFLARDVDLMVELVAYLLGQFPTSIETNGQLANRLADMVFFGLDRSDVDEYAARVKAVDSAAVAAVIARDFPKSGDLALVVIGDGSEIRDAVRKYGPVTEMKITEPTFAPPAAN